ncbi:MAG: hypothetical protein M3317_08125 [Actinomycetota bacterium]|nr:hypothetical protein [Actinomycetota bacterium]
MRVPYERTEEALRGQRRVPGGSSGHSPGPDCGPEKGYSIIRILIQERKM